MSTQPSSSLGLWKRQRRLVEPKHRPEGFTYEICQFHPTNRTWRLPVNLSQEGNSTLSQGCGDHYCRNPDNSRLHCVDLVSGTGHAECRRSESADRNSKAIRILPRGVWRVLREGSIGPGQVPGRVAASDEALRHMRRTCRMSVYDNLSAIYSVAQRNLQPSRTNDSPTSLTETS